MPSGTVGSQFSFKLLDAGEHTPLRRLVSEPLPSSDVDGGGPSLRRRRKPRAAKRNKKKIEADGSVSDDLSLLLQSNAGRSLEVENGHCMDGVGLSVSGDRPSVERICEIAAVEPALENSSEVCSVSFSELRQRNVNGSMAEGPAEETISTGESSLGQWNPESDENEKEDYLKASEFRGETSFMEKLPLKYFMGEIYGGNSLSSTISAGNEKKRQRVYNTMFHVPWRCERLIIAGFFVCLDSFLSLLTIMPARIAMAVWRVLKTRQFWRPSAAELSDFGCFIVLGLGVTSLQLVDISLIYHFIRGQGTVKLYVVYNVLEIFDKLCQSFVEDVLHVLFDSAERLSTSPPDIVKFELLRFFFDEAIAIIAFVIHSFVLLAQAITLSTCIIAHNNALLALLISNNFAEIKGNVFKRVSKENLHSLVCHDIVERFHITAFVLFVLAQNLLEAEGPWFGRFLTDVFTVYICEVLVDGVKHSFLAKFNEIKPIAYSEFLEDLSEQTLNEKPDERRKDLSFIPIAPACVVIRVLTPLYANVLSCGPLHRRLLWIFLCSSLTYIMLAIWKILVGSSLRRLATWYLNHRRERKQHVD